MHREGPEYVADGAQGDRLGVLTLGTVSGILERWCGHLRESRSIHEITKKVKQVSPSASETTRITGMKKKKNKAAMAQRFWYRSRETDDHSTNITK